MLHRWKDLFKPWVLARAQEYFHCGQVVEMEKVGSVVQAQVSGTQLYRVEITNCAGHVKMECDCPYAADGERCKHMAAVLFALEDAPVEERMNWQTALEQMSEEKLRGLLLNLAQEDESLQDRIVRMVSGPGDSPAQWKADLEQIILEYTDYRGRIGYDQGYYCLLDIAEYLDECIPSFLTKERIMNAVDLVMTVYDTAFGLDIDDSDGGLSYVSDACKSVLDEILALADIQEERKIFYLLHNYLEENDWVCGSDDLEELILSLNWSEALQRKNLEWLDENLDSWHISQRARLMERMGASKSEIISWWEQFRESDISYRPLLTLYEENDLSKAIELVREKRKQEHNTWRATEYTKTLLGLLEKAGKQEMYDSELRYLVMDLKCYENRYVAAFKNSVPVDQWPSTFECLLANVVLPSARMGLYHMEQMYAELFQELVRHPCLMDFITYEDPLRQWDSKQALTLYISILKQEMDRACDRNQYRHIIQHLHKLCTYPSGMEAAQGLAVYWYGYHKNRPAMKDELLKAGYPQE